MVSNCFYWDDEINPDIIYVPLDLDDITSLQNDFFKWIFDVTQSNASITEIDGMVACSYDTENFIFWINNYVLNKSNDKAYIVKSNSLNWDNSDYKLFF